MYPAMYYSHNLHFLAIAAAMEGRFTDARKAAAQLVAHVSPMAKDIPMLEGFLPTELLVLVRFHRWDDVLKLPGFEESAPAARGLWHFGRGMAYAAMRQFPEAERERQSLFDDAARVPADAKLGFNSAKELLSLAGHLLEGHISLARVSIPAAAEHFEQAAKIEDSLAYDEPPDWYIPPRESLGRAYMTASHYADAEKTFRAELAHHPRSGRALYGLWQSLKAQGKKSEAKQAEAEFRAAWKNADVKLVMEEL